MWVRVSGWVPHMAGERTAPAECRPPLASHARPHPGTPTPPTPLPTPPGRRGGYMECVNFPAGVKEQLYKLASISLCPNVSGQICMVRGKGAGRTGACGWRVGCAGRQGSAAVLGSAVRPRAATCSPLLPSTRPLQALIMNPPQAGDPSYELYARERDAILDVRALAAALPGPTRGQSAAAPLLLAAAPCPHAARLLAQPVAALLLPSPRLPPLQSLKRRAQLVVSTFRGLEGVTCNEGERGCRAGRGRPATR